MSKPIHLGVVNGRLTPCPTSPNCVSTQAESESQHLAPLRLRGSPQEAIEALAAVVARVPRTRIVTKTENYLHAEFITAIFRFVDDVEFLIDSAEGVIHFRSASRIGHWDLGANRRRMERIRRDWEQGASR